MINVQIDGDPIKRAAYRENRGASVRGIVVQEMRLSHMVIIVLSPYVAGVNYSNQPNINR